MAVRLSVGNKRDLYLLVTTIGVEFNHVSVANPWVSSLPTAMSPKAVLDITISLLWETSDKFPSEIVRKLIGTAEIMQNV